MTLLLVYFIKLAPNMSLRESAG